MTETVAPEMVSWSCIGCKLEFRLITRTPIGTLNYFHTFRYHIEDMLFMLLCITFFSGIQFLRKYSIYFCHTIRCSSIAVFCEREMWAKSYCRDGEGGFFNWKRHRSLSLMSNLSLRGLLFCTMKSRKSCKEFRLYTQPWSLELASVWKQFQCLLS